MSRAAFQIMIPARAHSQRLPGKLLLQLEGKSVLQRTWERASQSSAEQVWIVSGDTEILAAAEAFGAATLHTEGEHASGTERICEAVQNLALPEDALVVNVQGDEPLIAPAVIDQVAECLAAAPQAGLATAWTPIQNTAELFSADTVKVLSDAGERATAFSRAPLPWARQAFADGVPQILPEPSVWRRHLGIYAYRAKILYVWRALAPAPAERVECLEQLRALWHDIPVQMVRACEFVPTGVDTPEELEHLRSLLRAAESRQ